MRGARRPTWLGLLLLVAATARASAPATPEDTVRRYLQAMKDGKFADAYDLISKAMRGGKEREVWVKEQRGVLPVRPDRRTRALANTPSLQSSSPHMSKNTVSFSPCNRMSKR